MSIFDKITAAIHGAAVSVGTAWHDHVEPWLGNFLKTAVHAEIDAVMPIAQTYVAQAIPALVKAAASGDFQGFADAQWDAVVGAADEAKKQSIVAAITSVSTAVNALIVSHPDVIAATTAPVPSAPSTPVS